MIVRLDNPQLISRDFRSATIVATADIATRSKRTRDVFLYTELCKVRLVRFKLRVGLKQEVFATTVQYEVFM